MRYVLAVLIAGMAVPGAIAAQTAASSTAGRGPLSAPEAPRPGSGVPSSHPVEVALVDEGELGFVYRKFPTSERLYTNDRDTPRKSTCNGGCAAAWPPVLAEKDAKPVGRWTLVRRKDGTRQWALEGKPVYMRYHDAPDKPTGDGLYGIWRLVPYVPRAATPPVAASGAQNAVSPAVVAPGN